MRYCQMYVKKNYYPHACFGRGPSLRTFSLFASKTIIIRRLPLDDLGARTLQLATPQQFFIFSVLRLAI
jgi:hypothetical protein